MAPFAAVSIGQVTTTPVAVLTNVTNEAAPSILDGLWKVSGVARQN